MTASNTGHDRWAVYTCRSTYTAEVVEIIWRSGAEVAGLVDNRPGSGPVPGGDDLGPIVTEETMSPELGELPTAIAMTTPGHRYTAHGEARRAGFGHFPMLIDPTAVVARTAHVDHGTVVNAGVVVAAMARIGRFVHVNRRATIGHDNVIDDYATLGPGCVLAGHIHVGRGAFVGAGAVCAPHVSLGTNSVVGAGAVVTRDVPEHAVVVGNPARVLRTDQPGFDGVGVPLDDAM